MRQKGPHRALGGVPIKTTRSDPSWYGYGTEKHFDNVETLCGSVSLSPCEEKFDIWNIQCLTTSLQAVRKDDLKRGER